MVAVSVRLVVLVAVVFGLFACIGSDEVSAAEFSSGDYVLVNTDGLNLRSDAGTDGSVLAVLSFGSSLRILEGPRADDGYTWYRVQVSIDGGGEPPRGWVAADYIVTAREGNGADFQDALGVRVVDGPANIRNSPGLDRAIDQTVSTGFEARVSQTAVVVTNDGYDWVAVAYGDGTTTGWMATDFLVPLDYAPNLGSDDGWSMAEGVEVLDGPVNLRAEPSISGEILMTAATGSIINRWSDSELVTADGHSWIKLKSFSLADPAWAAIDYLKPIADMPCSDGACYPEELNPFYGVDAVVVSDGPVNLRANPGTGESILMTLESGDYLVLKSVLGPYEANGYLWLEVTVAGQTGFVATDFVRPVE